MVTRKRATLRSAHYTQCLKNSAENDNQKCPTVSSDMWRILIFSVKLILYKKISIFFLNKTTYCKITIEFKIKRYIVLEWKNKNNHLIRPILNIILIMYLLSRVNVNLRLFHISIQSLTCGPVTKPGNVNLCSKIDWKIENRLIYQTMIAIYGLGLIINIGRKLITIFKLWLVKLEVQI